MSYWISDVKKALRLLQLQEAAEELEEARPHFQRQRYPEPNQSDWDWVREHPNPRSRVSPLLRAIRRHLDVGHERFLERQARRKERAEMKRMGVSAVGTSAPPDPTLPEGVNDSWWDSLSPWQQERVVQQRAQARRIQTLRRQAKREIGFKVKHVRADVWQRARCAGCASIGRVKWLSPHHLERHYTNSRKRGGNAAIRKAHESFPNSLELKSEKHPRPANYIQGKFSKRRQREQRWARERTEKEQP
jgi:hypothetical protein